MDFKPSSGFMFTEDAEYVLSVEVFLASIILREIVAITIEQELVEVPQAAVVLVGK